MLRPRAKSVFPPLSLEAAADRQVWHLLRLMDGSRTTEQVCAAMRDKDPQLTEEEIRAMLDRLIRSGYVEDAAASPASFVDLEELERYRREVELFGFFNQAPLMGYDYRMRLRESRVTVLGVGGLGSYAAFALAAAGVGDLLLVDGGEVSKENLEAQVLCTEADIGKPRAAAASSRLGLIYPAVAVAGSSTMDDLRVCLRGRDLLLCTDNYRLVNEAALEERVPWLRCSENGLVVSMFLYVPWQTACFECERRSAHVGVSGATLNPCSATISGLLGSMAALEAIKRLSGMMEPATLGRRLIFDLRTMNIQLREGVRHVDCSMCGSRPG